MRYRILGPLEVQSPEGWAAIGAPKWKSLLACLLLRPGQLVSTDALIDELWGDAPPKRANNLVSIYVHRLRKLIGDAEGQVLVYRAPGYLLRLSPGDLDFAEFESGVAAGRAALTAGDAVAAAGLLGDALGLWRGPLLADVPPSELIGTQAEHAAELWLEATELRVEADLGCGRAAPVVAELRGLVREHPLRERLWLLLMRALEDAGRRAEALAEFARAQRVISAELGVDPGAELRRFYLELLAADASPTPPSPRRPRRRRGTSGAEPPGAGTDPARPGEEAQRAADDARAGGEPERTDRAGADGTAVAPPPGEVPGTIAVGMIAEVPPGPEAAGPAVSPMTPLAERPAQLPADIGDFTGRELHVDRVCALLLEGNAGGSPGAVRIAVVNGAGGLGKTTLAVHAAHRVSAQFPDGQLYVDLLGASPQAASPGEVLARFLRDLGVAGDKVPASDDERAALYRTTLTGRRVLILLDNAKDAAQVRMLLPGSSSCAVLVTTRNRTPDLAFTQFFDLDVLEDAEALALFTRVVGEKRAAAEPDATAEVLVACAGLPLAIRICAARLAARRGWKIATLAGRLRNQHRRLDELKTGDLAVRASFQVSYDSLRPASGGADPARAFRLLGLWQGAAISLPAAAALLGERDEQVAEMLESLVDVNLVESPAPDWYRFHDLLKVYALERAQAEEPAAGRDEAVRGLLYWYLDTAQAVADMVSPQRYQVPRELSEPGHPPLVFSGVEAALAWYTDERANIVAATRQAAAAGLHEVACRLPPTLFPMFSRRATWTDCVITHRIAADSAARTGDRPGEAWALNQLGYALVSQHDQGAFEYLERALAMRQELGDTWGEAQTAASIGEGYLVFHGAGKEALHYLQRAADLLSPMGAVSLRSVALNNLGEVYFGLDDLDAAARCYRQALEISREIGGHAEGHALANLGRVHVRQRRLDEAIARFEEALPRLRASGDRDGEAWTLRTLGMVRADAGYQSQARASLNEALRLFEQIGNRDQVTEIATLLDSLPDGPDQR